MAEVTHSSTHPPLPPTTEDDRLDWLRLLRSRRVGIATFWRLLADHGTARAALAALPAIARAAGDPGYAPCPEGVVLAEVKAARAAGARSLCAGDRAYPAALYDMPDVPPFLWARGDVTLLARPMVALVGARNASSLGLRMAKGLARDLSDQGYVVVSGLARGIDAAAHAATLAGGTVAAMAGGVDVIYPAENAALAADIARMGLLLTEQPMGLEPQARHFPARNRIIAGLARAVVVVEAAARSGSLITARAALDLGREVMAVPGHPMDARASGCNMLIRDGATLVRDCADVVEVIGPAGPAPRHPAAGPAAAPGQGPDGARQHPAPVVRVRHQPGTAPETAPPLAQISPDRPPPDNPDRPPPDNAASGPAVGSRTGEVAAPDNPDRPPPDNPGRPPPDNAASGPAVGSRTGAVAAPDGLKGQNPGRPQPFSGPMARPIPGPSVPMAANPAARPGSALREARPGPDLRTTATLHAAILDRLGPSPLAEDQLIRDLAAPAHAVAPALLDLEIDGRIIRQPGGLVALAV